MNSKIIKKAMFSVGAFALLCGATYLGSSIENENKIRDEPEMSNMSISTINETTTKNKTTTTKLVTACSSKAITTTNKKTTKTTCSETKANTSITTNQTTYNTTAIATFLESEVARKTDSSYSTIATTTTDAETTTEEITTTNENYATETTATPIQNTEVCYSDNDLYLLSHLINAEGGNQSWDYMIAVGSVALNRINYPDLGSNLYEVIHWSGQYSCIWDGNFDKSPNEASIEAAKYLLTHGSQYPYYVIFQSEFVQGDSIYATIGNCYLCYNSWDVK